MQHSGTRAEKLIQELDALMSETANWRNTWQELSDNIQPSGAGFTSEFSPGIKRRANSFDSTAEDASIRFASGLANALTSGGRPWFFLKAGEESLNDVLEVRLWLEDSTRRMLSMFNNSSVSNFHPSQFTKYQGIGIHGTAVQFIGDKPGLGPYFQTQFLGNCLIDVDETSRVDTLFRIVEYTPHAALRMFKHRTPAKLAKIAASGQDRNKIFKFLHAVKPREERNPRAPDARNMRWGSWWVWIDESQEIMEGGFQEFPFVVPRWTVNIREKYGRGPGHTCLADAKLINMLEKTNLVGLQKIIDPALLIQSGSGLRTLDLRPAAQNRVNDSFAKLSEMVLPIQTGGRPDIGEAKISQMQEKIRRAFFNDIFQLPGPIAEDGDVLHMSATESAIRQRDRLEILVPIYTRMVAEDLGPLINRSLMVMLRNNMLAPLPEALAETGLDVEYQNPLAIAQRSADVGAVLQGVDAMAPLAQFRPDVMDIWDGDATARHIGRTINVPSHLFRSEEQIAKIRQQRAEQQAQERQAELNQMDSQALKNVAEAGAR